MTLQEFASLFPKRAFALRYVERGEKGARKFVWHLQYTNDYFTSDTDRDVYNHGVPNYPDGFGDSPEEAIDDLLAKSKERNQMLVLDLTEQLESAKENARKLEESLSALSAKTECEP